MALTVASVVLQMVLLVPERTLMPVVAGVVAGMEQVELVVLAGSVPSIRLLLQRLQLLLQLLGQMAQMSRQYPVSMGG
jgi:hypothetical protein